VSSTLREQVAVSKHEKYLRDLRCVVSKSPFVTLHHCHGGSIKVHGWHVGMGQKQNPFLQIPLSWMYHTGDHGIDRIGVLTWEDRYGTQMEKLRWVNDQLPYDLFEQARSWERKKRRSTITRRFTSEG
jgi:hypothetical protein